MEAERLTPILQWTRHLAPAFLRQAEKKHVGLKMNTKKEAEKRKAELRASAGPTWLW